jgi:lipopolysaccharide biosynthesis glycosyltransferase
MNKPDIAITIDEDYVQHACVMLESLIKFNVLPINIHVVHNNLSEESITLLTKQFSKTNLHLHFYQVETEEFSYLPIRVNDHVSITTYFRILLPEILSGLDSVLFLDSDIIINGSLTPLFTLDMGNNAIAAVKDVVVDSMPNKKESLEIPQEKIYFNAGILKMNLSAFRKNNITKKVLEYIQEYPARCQFWDQDALNAFFKGEFYPLAFTYNVQSELFFSEILKHDPNIIEAVTNPVIIHYCGNGVSKPWFYNNRHPLKHLYYEYLQLTQFKKYKAPDTPLFFERTIKSVVRSIRNTIKM